MEKSSVNKAIFANRFRQALNQSGLSCSKLSKLSGISKSNLCRYLQEAYAPKVGNVLKIAEVLNVDYEWLMGTTEIQQEQARQKEELQAQLEKELLTDNYIFVGDLSDEQKRLMKQLVNQYRKK